MCLVASLLHSVGDYYDDPWCKLCLWLVTFKNCHYDLTNCSVGRCFVTWLSSEIYLFSEGSINSEMVLVFVSSMLQQDAMVQKGTDIHRLVGRHLQHWKEHCFEDLVAKT